MGTGVNGELVTGRGVGCTVGETVARGGLGANVAGNRLGKRVGRGLGCSDGAGVTGSIVVTLAVSKDGEELGAKVHVERLPVGYTATSA